MDLHIKPFEELSLTELYDILRIRQEVFFLEQKVDCEDLDGIDSLCVHMWEEQSGEITGYLRIIPAGLVYEQASIGRVLTKAAYRHRGISRRMMKAAIEYISSQWGTGQITISAQSYLKDYYSEFGFVVVSGEYPDGGIPHYKMRLGI